MHVGSVTVTYDSPGIDAEIAPVCSGDELEYNCTLQGRALEWVVTLPQDMTIEHPFNSVDYFFPVHTVTVSNTSFTFSRISPPNSRPLISGLLISPATSVVNGTLVVCEDGETRANSSTRVNVVHNNSTLTDNAVRGRSSNSYSLQIIKTGTSLSSIENLLAMVLED